MKFSTLLISAFATTAVAWPGMSKTMTELRQELARRQSVARRQTTPEVDGPEVDPPEVDPPEVDPPEAGDPVPEGPEGEDSDELIGDLLPAKGGIKTATGQTVSNILLGTETPQSTTLWTGTLPGPLTAKCKADTCCIWRHIAIVMELAFRGISGRGNKNARAAIRLGMSHLSQPGSAAEIE
jgi:hypothetical protein